jgi:hypothetical protein
MFEAARVITRRSVPQRPPVDVGRREFVAQADRMLASVSGQVTTRAATGTSQGRSR